MKQVIALLGSKRKKNTYRILIEIQRILENHNIKMSIIELYSEHIEPCLGCEHCILEGNCVINDDTTQIMNKLINADGIILASPVYLQQVSGQLKTFFDRTCMWYHRPILTKKPILSVATTKGSGLKKTLSYLESITVQWGAIPAGKVGRTIFTQDKHISEEQISKFIKLIDEPQKHIPNLNQLINFEIQKAMALYLNNLDREYWEKKNWDKQSYYYTAKINLISKYISHRIGKFIQDKIKTK